MIVVADTSPLNYLIQIDAVEVLPALFERILTVPSVQRELQDLSAPNRVRKWINNAPVWLEIQNVSKPDQTIKLGAGETEAISLAIEVAATQVLLDDKAARKAAEARGLRVTGTLAIISLAAESGLLDFEKTLKELRNTNFRISNELLDELIKRHNQN